MLRGRLRTTTWLYDDPDHPDRVTGTVEAPAYTEEDRALLLALAMHESSLCPGCGEPKAHAWHSELDGWYEATQLVCHACTARNDDGHQVVYAEVRSTVPDDRLQLLSPLEIGVNTTPPDPPS